MRNILDGNIISVKDINIYATGIIPEVVACKNIRIVSNTDTNDVQYVRYECVDPDSFATFIIKVNAKKPVVELDAFEKMNETLYLQLPVDEISIKPYSIEFGKAKVSIIAPSVSLAEN